MIPKYFYSSDKSSINLRRIWHLVLILIILFLLFLVSTILYNEIVNEKKLVTFFKELNETENLIKRLDSTNIEHINGQESLIKYLISNNKEDIQDYIHSLNNVKNMMDTVRGKVNSWDGELTGPKIQPKDLELNQKLDLLIDSLSQNLVQNFNGNKTSGNVVKRLEYNDLSVKTTIETKSSIDSVEKKGLFGRLGDALKGDVDVQKEKTDVTMILEYRGKKTEGTVDEQMGNVIKMVSDYYENALKKTNQNWTQLSQQNKNLLLNTSIIQNLSDEVFANYKKVLEAQRNILSHKYNTQYTKNRTIRLYALLGLSALLILLTFAVLYLTKITYDIENKLLIAKEKIADNLKFKNKIVSMISHDIRSPLNIILLYIKQVLKLEKDPKKIEVFNSINYTTDSAFLLANRILDFSKSENQLMEVYRDEFDLQEEINQILGMFNTLAVSKNHNLINVNKISPKTDVVFDRSKLQRLYFNLLGNAISYTEGGNIEVKSDGLETEKGKLKFTLSITDSGKGISEENLKNIFEPYTKSSGNLPKNQNFGVGLGLYLCKEITELFDGSIDIQSKPGKGTTVTAFMFMEKKN